MLRELSTLISPCFFKGTRYDRDFLNHPFGRELSCLQRKDSIGVHKTDGACFEKAVEGFKAENLNSGLYFYKIEAGSFVEIKKMMLVK